MISPNLEQTLRKALEHANMRCHEYATLEHLMLALTEDEDAVAVLRACNVDLERIRSEVEDFIDHNLDSITLEESVEAKAHPGLPEDASPGGRPRPVIGGGYGDRCERPGGNVLGTGEPCRLVPAEAGHDATRCRELHQPWCFENSGAVRTPGCARNAGGRGGGPPGRRGARGLLRQSQREGKVRKDRSSGREATGG